MSSHLTVLGWHNVESTWCFPVTGSGAAGLEGQLRRLRKFANVVPLEEALDSLREGRPLPPRAVALCWDDGYVDNLRLAVPILEKLGLPGTFFLVPGLLSRESRAWWEVAGWAFERSSKERIEWRGMRLFTRGQAGRICYGRAADTLRTMAAEEREEALADLVDRLAAEGEPGDAGLFLDWNDAKELVSRGFSVGSHTMRHATLAQESPKAQFEDLRQSRETLEGELGVPIRVVAYPFGQSDAVSEATRDAAERAGYAHGLTTEFGWNTRATPIAHGRRIMLEPHIGFAQTVVGRVAGRIQARRE
ncbi:polysaccharide deacetylase family protein [Sinosporangium siamense]|uniref:NodB homology domain-containing protein n=1 Tax=Sinosporangium siamense TaxID=1367973 RepID=A0A919RJI5_9ACTN|nr:polysaccharide deacetylase family protein [Sinosporangium siamense]GII93509.1 hypothetical protein Ssi02_37400 [Sinosporangium siamense]